MYEGPIQELIDELARLPGIGPKSAQRLAFWLVKTPPEEAKRLAHAIVQATTHYKDPDVLARVSEDLGEAMPGLEVSKMAEHERMASRGW